MTDYISWADLKTVIIRLITGIIGGLLVLGIQRYWSNRTIQSVKRRIEYAEAQKAQLESLAKSERAVILFGLGALFGVLGLMNFISAAQSLTFKDSPMDIVRAMLWGIPGLLCFAFVYLLQQVEKYPDSIKRIEKRLEKLRSKLPGSG